MDGSTDMMIRLKNKALSQKVWELQAKKSGVYQNMIRSRSMLDSGYPKMPSPKNNSNYTKGGPKYAELSLDPI